MATVRRWLTSFGSSESGRIAVEYAVAAALIAIAVIAGIRLVGTAANNQNNATSNMLQTSASTSSS
jgi:Flp pilus assembly pilin Flp